MARKSPCFLITIFVPTLFDSIYPQLAITLTLFVKSYIAAGFSWSTVLVHEGNLSTKAECISGGLGRVDISKGNIDVQRVFDLWMNKSGHLTAGNFTRMVYTAKLVVVSAIRVNNGWAKVSVRIRHVKNQRIELVENQSARVFALFVRDDTQKYTSGIIIASTESIYTRGRPFTRSWQIDRAATEESNHVTEAETGVVSNVKEADPTNYRDAIKWARTHGTGNRRCKKRYKLLEGKKWGRWW